MHTRTKFFFSTLPIPAAALILALIGFSGLTAAPARTQAAAPKPEILIVGTYHMANPGRDVFNTQADDVLTPKRQAEMAELLAVLKAFRPTKVAIESAVYLDTRPKQYADYLAGKYTLGRNEIEQVGFRLAKEMGLKTVDPVDYDGDFPRMRVVNYAKANGRSPLFDRMQDETGARVKVQGEYMASHTILETLLFMNSDDAVLRDMGDYIDYLHFGEAGDYAGADLVASWYQRNVRIYTNIVNLIESPAERILVVYGAGHLGWLRQVAENDPAVRLRKLAEFIPGAKK